MITAKEAAKLSFEYYEKQPKLDEENNIFKKITKAAESGQSYLTLYNPYLSEKIQKKLKDLGYKVYQSVHTITITW